MSSFKLVWDKFKLIFRYNSRIFPWNWWSGDVSRVGIGARNPYAVYRSMYQEDPFTPSAADIVEGIEHLIDPAVARELLGKLCTVDGCFLPYEKLFDPVYGSCLFCKETIKEARRIKSNEIASVRLSLSNSSRDDSHGSSESDNRAGAGGICVIDHWDPATPPPVDEPSTIVQQWLGTNTRNPGFPDEVHPAYDDPLQGGVTDCYFIAAISSIAWYYYNFPPDPLDQVGPIVSHPANPITFKKTGTVYSISGTGIAPKANTTPVNIDYTLPKDSGEHFAGAKPKNGVSCWVPYYEKAFARYLETINEMPAQPPNNPNICAIPCGDPGETLRALLHKDSVQRFTMGSIDPNFKDTVWSELTLKVVESPPIPKRPADAARRTIVPAVARTYTTAPSGCDYDSCLIAGAHAYSLLGVVEDSLKKRYVILRNPWGQNDGYDYSMQYRPDHSLKYTLIGNVGETIDPIKGPFPDAFSVTFPKIKVGIEKYSFNLWETVTLHGGQIVYRPKQGRFAILIDDFVKYFAEFDYVQVN